MTPEGQPSPRPYTPATMRNALLPLAVSLALLPACTGSQRTASEDPAIILADPDSTRTARKQAIRDGWAQAEAGEIDRALWRESVKKIAWSASSQADLRIVAIDSLLADDPDDTRAMLALIIPRDPSWPVIEHTLNLAVERAWTDMTPAIVRSWSRPVIDPPDERRPERAALVELHPGREVPDIVFDVFLERGDGSFLADRARTDAWTLLCRIDPSMTTVRARLASLAGDPRTQEDPLLQDLVEGARQLAAVPVTGEQLEWLRDLRKPENRDFLEQASAVIATLSPEQLEGFEMRHAAGVRWAAEQRPEWLRAPRAELLAQAEQTLSGRKRYTRIADDVTGYSPPREMIDSYASDLVWGDALLILIAIEAMDDPAIVASMFEQADEDLDDTTTEWGGVLDARSSSFIALSYPPRPVQRVGDNRFVASPELLAAGAPALFHYHFHARQTALREYAGPSRGDLEYAQRFGRSCLVLTFITRDALDADYYQPDGAVIDLGVIRRP